MDAEATASAPAPIVGPDVISAGDKDSTLPPPPSKWEKDEGVAAAASPSQADLQTQGELVTSSA